NTVNRTPANTLAYEAPNPFDIRATAFPGRYTTVQVRLDDKTLKWVPGSNVQFDEDNFTSINYDPLILAIRGHISDYIAFDLTNVPSGERPVVESTGNPAEKVLFSGDGIAISEGLGSSSVFELLDPVVIKSGTISEGPVINGKKALNSYKLDETDPSLSIKTALVGIWRNSTEVISATDTVSMVAFPNSDDNNRQTLVLFKQNSAGKISGMWHGYVDYDATDTTKGVFKLFPIGTLTTGETTGQEVNGTVSNITRANGAVKRADWDATGTLPLNFSFPATGAFSVVR
ncbi:MAG: hypothetical protein K8R88_03990, partial [Armatimonadetes bacterium]|nr:hypothetical protein [Armatimonadota bacterium]